MVKVSLKDIPENEQSLLEFVSTGSDSDFDLESCDGQTRAAKQREYEAIAPSVPLNTKFPTVVLVTGLPRILPDRLPKLHEALKRRIVKELAAKEIIKPLMDPFKNPSESLKIEITVSESFEDGTVLGVAFVDFKCPRTASRAAKALNHVGLDSKHPFRVCLVDEFDQKLQEEVKVRPEYNFFNRAKFRNWLKDPLGREQYIVRRYSTPEKYVFWHDAITPEHCFQTNEGKAVCWSPLGTYMAVFFQKGISLRAGDSFDKQIKFEHRGVTHVVFSPNEEYMVTWDAPLEPEKRSEMESFAWEEGRSAARCWETLTGKCLKCFTSPDYACAGLKDEYTGSLDFLMFSHDSEYLAIRREKDLVVYATGMMGVLEDKSPEEPESALKTKLNYAYKQFQWSPTGNVLSLWIPEGGDSPGRLLLVEIPSRHEIASRNVFSVTNVTMHWHHKGEFLALLTIIARKKGKKTKKETTQIEIFRVMEKSIPVDTVTMEESKIASFYWEKGPSAKRFAVITINEATAARTINFYHVSSKGSNKDTELVETLPVPQSINTLAWSPAGQYFVLASRGTEGVLMFCFLNEQNKAEIIFKEEQAEVSYVQWDPSGRFVTTALFPSGPGASLNCPMNTEYRIYSFLGRYQGGQQDCVQFLWRNRPASLLPPSKAEEVQKRFKEYSKKYDSLDESRRQSRRSEILKCKEEQLNSWNKTLKAALDFADKHPRNAEWKVQWRLLEESLDWVEETEEVEGEVLEVTRVHVDESSHPN